MRSLGFTGTRLGPTTAQIAYAMEWISLVAKPLELHHGDCIGCDEWVDAAVRNLKRRPVIHVHPPKEPKYRAYCEGDVIHEPETYLRRNESIVAFSDGLLALPAQQREIRRSGTWSTIRRAEKKGIPIHIIYPDGRLEDR